MKSPRYTAGVVSIYRKYVDRYLECGRDGYYVEQEDRRTLLDLSLIHILIVEISKYLMILLMAVYTYANFRFLSFPDMERKRRVCRCV